MSHTSEAWWQQPYAVSRQGYPYTSTRQSWAQWEAAAWYAAGWEAARWGEEASWNTQDYNPHAHAHSDENISAGTAGASGLEAPDSPPAVTTPQGISVSTNTEEKDSVDTSPVEPVAVSGKPEDASPSEPSATVGTEDATPGDEPSSKEVEPDATESKTEPPGPGPRPRAPGLGP